MGRIKTRVIKNNAKKFSETYGDMFGTDFQKNKEALKSLDMIKSKKVLNKIAGSLTRLYKNKKF